MLSTIVASFRLSWIRFLFMFAVQSAASLQVAFGPGGAGASSTSIRTFGAAKDGNDGKSGSVVLKDSDDDEQNLSTFPSASTEAETDVTMEDAIDPDAEPLQGVKNTECWVRTCAIYVSTSLYLSVLLSFK